MKKPQGNSHNKIGLENMMLKHNFKEIRVCEWCGKLTNINTKAKHYNIATDKTHYFCTKLCKTKYINYKMRIK